MGNKNPNLARNLGCVFLIFIIVVLTYRCSPRLSEMRPDPANSAASAPTSNASAEARRETIRKDEELHNEIDNRDIGDAWRDMRTRMNNVIEETDDDYGPGPSHGNDGGAGQGSSGDMGHHHQDGGPIQDPPAN